MSHLTNVKLTLVIGQYAQAYQFPGRGASVSSTVQSWREIWPKSVPLPHPSPRNNIWLKNNPWFGEDLLPVLKARVAEVLGNSQ